MKSSSRRNSMKRAVIGPVLFALVLCAGRAQATDLSGTISSTVTIFDDSRLVGDVSCNVPLTAADATGVAACIAFGASHITLHLNGHTLTGPVNPPANCSLPSDSTFGVGIYVNSQSQPTGVQDVKIEGPGVIQKFQRWGIALRPGTGVTVRKVTVNRNCWSGIQVTGTSDSTFEEDILTNNAAGSNGAACGGICLFNSHKNRIHKSTFYGNGSVDYTSAGNVDFGVGFEGTSSENLVEESDIGGNTNGILFFNTSSDNVVRRNVIVGNPAAQVIKTFVPTNQQGADIAFRSSFTGANNTFKDNLCLTYIQGGGPATAPCPNIIREGVEEAVNRLTSPSENAPGSGRTRTAEVGAGILFAVLLLGTAFWRSTPR
jgi:hypothetical protein